MSQDLEAEVENGVELGDPIGETGCEGVGAVDEEDLLGLCELKPDGDSSGSGDEEAVEVHRENKTRGKC